MGAASAAKDEFEMISDAGRRSVSSSTNDAVPSHVVGAGVPQLQLRMGCAEA